MSSILCWQLPWGSGLSQKALSRRAYCRASWAPRTGTVGSGLQFLAQPCSEPLLCLSGCVPLTHTPRAEQGLCQVTHRGWGSFSHICSLLGSPSRSSATTPPFLLELSRHCPVVVLCVSTRSGWTGEKAGPEGTSGRGKFPSGTCVHAHLLTCLLSFLVGRVRPVLPEGTQLGRWPPHASARAPDSSGLNRARR